jgi:hypothetical protein
MSDSSSDTAPAAKPSFMARWGLRLVLLIVLAVAIVLAVMEWRVQSNFNESYGAISAAMEKGEIFRDSVGTYLKGSYKHERVDDQTDRYVWKSVFFFFGDHALRLHCEKDGFVVRIEHERETKAAPAGGDQQK